MATKNNRRTLITKRILKESLLELMQEKPISKISIKEICDLSEMSRSTFYLHYQDQFELLKDIEDDTLERTFEALRGIDNTWNTVEAIERFLNYVKTNKETFGVLLCQPDTEDFQISIMEKIGEYVRLSVPDLHAVRNSSYLFTFVMHGSTSVMRQWINADCDVEVPVLAELLYRSCYNVIPGN